MPVKLLINLCLLVALVGADWCPYCVRQIEELDTMKIDYVYVKNDAIGYRGPIPLLRNEAGREHTGLLKGEELRRFAEEKE